jgi:uncharacterized protein YaaW (UPF0174 family)
MAIVYYSTQQLEQKVLSRATAEELLAVTRIFNPEASSAGTPKSLAATICGAGGSSMGNLLRSQGVPYTELLHDVAELLKVGTLQSLKIIRSSGLTVAEMDARVLNPIVANEVSSNCKGQLEAYVQHHEREVLNKFAQDAYQRMSAEQRLEVDKQIRELAKKTPGFSMAGIGTSAALLAAASVSGFAPYLLLSTVISTVSGGAAIFGVYTAASSALHLLLGPPGWAALGAAAIHKFGSPDQQKCLKASLAIALLRGKLEQSTIRVIR